MRTCVTVTADTGASARLALGEQDFDVVLMHMQMPVMDGFQATAAILRKESTTGKHQLIIAVTAPAMKGDREKCLESGMDGYLSKPLRVEELAETLAKVRSHRPLKRTLIPACLI